MTKNRSDILNSPYVHYDTKTFTYSIAEEAPSQEKAAFREYIASIQPGGDPLLAIPSEHRMQYMCNRDACITQ